MDEGEVRVEGSRRQTFNFVDLPQIGDPFVDQDQTWRILLEDRFQQVGAGRDAVGIILGDHVEGLGPTELPRQFAPGRTNFSGALGNQNILWSSRGADEHRAIDLLGHGQAVLVQQPI